MHHKRIFGSFLGGPQLHRPRLVDPVGASDNLTATLNGDPPLTHGIEVAQDGSNVGYQAYYAPSLGRKVQLSDLEVITGNHYQTDFFAPGTPDNPTIVFGKHFTGYPLINVDYITYRACLFDIPPSGYVSGGNAKGITLDWCTVSPPEDAGVYPYGMGNQSFSMHRCLVRGGSDGLRCNGGPSDQVISESLIQVKMASPADHNDSIQNVGGNGRVIITRCRLDLVPEGGILVEEGNSGGPNAVFMASEFASASRFHGEVNNCLIDCPGLFALRFYDGALTTKITYAASGNLFERHAAMIYPVHRGSSNITPLSQVSWSRNYFLDDLETEIELR